MPQFTGIKWKNPWLLGVYSAALTLLLLSLVVSPAVAQDPNPPPKSLGGADPNSIFIHLVADTFDPLLRQPNIPAELTFTPEELVNDGTYLVQFSGPVQEVWVQALEQLGAQVGPYVPDYAYIVHLDTQSKAKVESLSFVRWVGAYEPAYRVSPRAEGLAQNTYLVMLLPWADSAALTTSLAQVAQAAAARLQAAELPVEQYAADGLSVVLDTAGVQQAAHLPGVLWLEPLELNVLFNDVAGTIMNAGTAWGMSLNGSGITVGVADGGLDTGNIATLHGDFTGRVSHAVSYPVQQATYGSCVISNAGANDGWADTTSGHGTHVTGSLAGSGSRSGGQFKGLAYNAALTFQGVEQLTTFSGTGCTSGYYLTGIPADAGLLLEEAYGWGVRVHNDSWGSAVNGAYTTSASNFDKRIASHRDLLVTVAAGNEGKDANNDGYVDEDSMTSPATAKNVLTVGVTDSERSSGGLWNYTWGGGWPASFKFDPTKSDFVSDSRQEMAAFSSRGPTDDGRIKPDLVAPGTNIISTRSSVAPGGGWGIYNTDYMYNGGTSMAAPLAAGAAALVREYYIEKMGLPDPSAALIKATLINTAVDITGYGNTSKEAGQPIPNMHEGWGRINVGAAVTTGSRQVTDNNTGLTTGGFQQFSYVVAPGKPFKVTLVWSDIEATPAAGTRLVNNLDLEVIAPDGSTVYRGNAFSGGWSVSGGVADTLNNVENVYLQSPTAGQWVIRVKGFNVPSGPQPFALVVDGNVSLAAPSILSISPNKGLNDASLNGAVISGSYLAGATNVKLTKGPLTVTGAITANTETQVTANFPLTGAAPGVWDLAVTNPFGTAVKSQAFIVLDATLPDLRLTLNAVGTPFSSAAPVTFTLQLENASLITATGVVFTHTLPAGISSPVVTPTCITFTLLTSGYRCAVGSLGANATAVYTVTAQAAEGLRGLLTTQATVGSSVPDRWPADNTDTLRFIVDQMDAYLPYIVRNFPLTPGAPVLQPISNADDDGNYTLTWSAPEGNPVSGYDIEQNGSILVSGWGSTSYAITGKAPGYYAYRVRAINNYGPGPWSSIQTALVNPLRNWNFELGNNGDWTWGSVLNVVPIGPPPTGFSAHSGTKLTWLGGWNGTTVETNNWIQQSVTIPAGATQLTYWYWILATDNCGFDKVEVKFGTTVLATHNLCANTNMSGWAQGTIAIGAYGGQAVALRFHLTQDTNYVSNFLLDDIEIK